MGEHPEGLEAFIKVCEARAARYRAFLGQVARLMVSVARAAEAGIKAMLERRGVPETVFGRRRMAQMLHLRIPTQVDPGAAGREPGLKRLSMGAEPCGPTRWSSILLS